MQVIYLDVLLALNLFVNYLVLISSAAIIKMPVKRLRVLFGSAVGAVYSLVIFAPHFGVIISLALRLAASLLIVLAAFGYKNKKAFVKAVISFNIVTMVYGGVCTAMTMLPIKTDVVINNSACYIDVSLMAIVAYTSACYFAIAVINRFFKPIDTTVKRYTVEILLNKNPICLEAIVDTGNSLKDVFSSLPVAVCDIDALKGDVTPEAYADILAGNYEKTIDYFSQAFGLETRLVPYSAVGQSGLIICVKPKSFTVKFEGKKLICNALIGLSPSKIKGDFSCILNPQIIDFATKIKESAVT